MQGITNNAGHNGTESIDGPIEFCCIVRSFRSPCSYRLRVVLVAVLLALLGGGQAPPPAPTA
ncbi:MAG: hypothetical protein Q3997_05690 [Propionibacteriaceae bacterium]|nr:hypothetical protein [Propionibacteriaceae bacterium]